jgi:isopenicillin N synthase-like dioxygenase
VEAKDGSWIPAEPVPGAFVVNIGDIVDTLTSHQYKSTFHRVIHRGDKYRVSIPFFFEPSIDSVIKPLKGLVPEGQEGDVKPFKVRSRWLALLEGRNKSPDAFHLHSTLTT